MKLSVVIPIYNAEHTLRRCINSLTEQINDDVELLLINDGSIDSSETICQEYVNEYPYVHYIKQKNCGVSGARNTGIKHALGKYVSFVDSDDYVAPEYISTIVRYIDEWNPSLITFSFVTETKTDHDWCYFDKKKQIALKYQELSKQQKMCSCVTSVYKKAIIDEKQIRFDKRLRIAEDEAFLFMNVVHADSVLYTLDELYHIDAKNQDSLSRKANQDLSKQLILANQLMYDTINSVELSTDVKTVYYEKVEWSFFRSAYSVCLEEFKSADSFRSRIIRIRNTCNVFVNERIKPHSFKCRLMSLPIRLRMSLLLYFIMKLKTK